MGKLATTLAKDISNDDTIIPVEITVGFPVSGLLKIDNEIISYTSKGIKAFNVNKRGIEGTVPYFHKEGSLVYLFEDNPLQEDIDQSVKLYGKDISIDFTSGEIDISGGDILLVEGVDSIKNILIMAIESKINESITTDLGISVGSNKDFIISQVEETLNSIDDVESFELLSVSEENDKLALVYNIKLVGSQTSTNVPFIVRK